MTSINNKTITSVYEKMKAYERISKKLFILLFMLVFYGYSSIIAQPSIPAGQVDIFVGADFNYRDLFHNGKIYEILLNLTPGVKWNMGKGWQAAAQALVPVYNDYGEPCDNLDVLDKLQAAFSQKYPEASPKWKTRSNYYIADFQNQNYAAEAWFTSDAVWLMTETDLPHASLPEAVKNAFKNSEYGQWSLDDVDMLVREGMEPVYVLEVEQGPREMDLYYNAEGILIKVVEDSEDDSEDYLPIELPEEVKNFLQEKYAASKIVETDQEHGQFEVDIIHDGVAKEVLFDNSGNWLSSSWEISLDTLPEVVKTAIRQEINDKYVGYETDDEPELVETPDGNYYRIELEAEDDREVILKIREDGSLLQ